jgi:hypothetical protein
MLLSLILRIVKFGIIERDRPRDLGYEKRLGNLLRKLRSLDTEKNEANMDFLIENEQYSKPGTSRYP